MIVHNSNIAIRWRAIYSRSSMAAHA